MATSTELLRAAEHMRSRAKELDSTIFADAADLLEREAKYQVVVKVKPKRSWPEGWPPFAVLRRSYSTLDCSHRPSAMAFERQQGITCHGFRRAWAAALGRESA